jgi:hypothetical protein
VRTHLKEDEDFAAQFEEAKGKFRDRIETEITRRAIEGVNEYVTTSKGLIMVESDTEMEHYQDASTGEVKSRPKLVPLMQRRYSDSLLMFHAKRHIPEYREKSQVDVNHSGGVLLVPAGQSLEQWEKENARPAPIDVTPERK